MINQPFDPNTQLQQEERRQDRAAHVHEAERREQPFQDGARLPERRR